jgi:prepilin-type N-terminal cleavage/methylation domain-containing protein
MRKTMNNESGTMNHGKRFVLLGFTLIELLVVISIIGILAALGTARYTTAEKNARDTQRKSDLNQYRTALENYATANGSIYPTASGEVSAESTGLCEVSDFVQDYLSGVCLTDIRASEEGRFDYLYYSSDGVNYVLAAQLEKEESLFYELCSNGRAGEVNEAPVSDICSVN